MSDASHTTTASRCSARSGQPRRNSARPCSARSAGGPSHGAAYQPLLPGSGRQLGFPHQNETGWAARTLKNQSHEVYNPITSQLQVIRTDGRGAICIRESRDYQPPRKYRGEYAGPTRKFHRRKGMSEFAEIAQVPRSQWTPAHRQAMEQNSTVFHRQVGEFAAVIEALHHRATAKAEGEKAARQRPQSARPASRPAQASPRLAEKTQQARASAVPVPAATPQEPAKAPPPAGGRTSARPTHQAAKAAARGPSQARPAK
mmetsp:Transcript_35974/g.78570  ORF Transcript_35974/g.78570 Transcript_35974/m.78570 type:complete len:259 (+) Transcript_35974:23-799(+)